MVLGEIQGGEFNMPFMIEIFALPAEVDLGLEGDILASDDVLESHSEGRSERSDVRDLTFGQARPLWNGRQRM